MSKHDDLHEHVEAMRNELAALRRADSRRMEKIDPFIGRADRGRLRTCGLSCGGPASRKGGLESRVPPRLPRDRPPVAVHTGFIGFTMFT